MQPGNLPSFLSLGPTGPMPWCSSMVMPSTYPSLQRVTWVWWQRGILAMSLGERSTNWRFVTSWLRLPSGLPRRTQWVSSTSDNVSAWVAIHWHDYAWRWINFPTSDLSQSTTKGQESKVLSLSSGLSPTPATSPTRALPQSRRPNQHDYGGQQTPIPGSSGHFWSSIQKFHPKKTRVPGLDHTTTY